MYVCDPGQSSVAVGSKYPSSHGVSCNGVSGVRVGNPVTGTFAIKHGGSSFSMNANGGTTAFGPNSVTTSIGCAWWYCV